MKYYNILNLALTSIKYQKSFADSKWGIDAYGWPLCAWDETFPTSLSINSKVRLKITSATAGK